jgi:hypothetical protein
MAAPCKSSGPSGHQDEQTPVFPPGSLGVQGSEGTGERAAGLIPACRRFWHKHKQQLALWPLRRGHTRGRAKRQRRAPRPMPGSRRKAGSVALRLCHNRLFFAVSGQQGRVRKRRAMRLMPACIRSWRRLMGRLARSPLRRRHKWLLFVVSVQRGWARRRKQAARPLPAFQPFCYGSPSSAATACCFLRSAVSRDGRGGSSGENGCRRPADTAGAGSGGGWLGHPSGTATTSCSSNNTGFVSNSTVCRKTVIVVLLLA